MRNYLLSQSQPRINRRGGVIRGWDTGYRFYPWSGRMSMKRLLAMGAAGCGVCSCGLNRQRGTLAKPVQRSDITSATRLQWAKRASFEAIPNCGRTNGRRLRRCFSPKCLANPLQVARQPRREGHRCGPGRGDPRSGAGREEGTKVIVPTSSSRRGMAEPADEVDRAGVSCRRSASTPARFQYIRDRRS